MQDFAQKLKEARIEAGFTQQSLADWTLIPMRTIQDWEAAKRTPPPYVQRFVLNELELFSDNWDEHERKTLERMLFMIDENNKLKKMVKLLDEQQK